MTTSHATRNTIVVNALLVPFDVLIVAFAVYVLLGLPDSAKLAEISKIATLLLTVEGILLGLSPLVFEKFGRLGPVFVLISAYALLWSLLTIILGDTIPNLSIMGTVYIVDLAFFQGVILMIVVFASRTQLK